MLWSLVLRRFLGLIDDHWQPSIVKNVRPQITPIGYRTFAHCVDLMPTSPIMADLLKSSLRQARVLSEADELVAHKKPHLETIMVRKLISMLWKSLEDLIVFTSQPRNIQ